MLLVGHRSGIAVGQHGSTGKRGGALAPAGTAQDQVSCPSGGHPSGLQRETPSKSGRWELYSPFYFSLFLLLFKYNCLHFSPYTPPADSSHPHLPPSVLPHFGFGYVSFIHVLRQPLSLPPVIPSSSPLVTVSLFFISMSLVQFCSFVCFVDWVPLIHEIIWYLSFTAWLILLSIMLSSSIHDVAQGISSFFLSAAIGI